MRLELPAPLSGLNRAFRLSEQPVSTSRDLSNVRPLDETTGRIRLSMRPGLTPFFSGFLGGSGNKIQALASTGYQSRHISYAADSIPDELWAYSFASGATASVCAPGRFDDLWVVENALSGSTVSSSTVRRLSRYGVQLGSIGLPNYAPSNVINTVTISQDGFAAYVASTDYIGSPASSGTRIWKIAIGSDGLTLSIAWEIVPGSTGRYPVRLWEYQDKLYSVENDYVSAAQTTINLAYYTDLANTAQNNPGTRWLVGTYTGTQLAAFGSNGFSGGDGAYAHDMALQTNAGLHFVIQATNAHDTSGSGNVMFRVGTDGATDTNYVLPRTAVAINGGIGYSCDVDTVGSVISTGKTGGSDVWLRKVTDTSTAWAVNWTRLAATDLGGAANTQQYAYPRMQIDAFGNSAVPTARSNISVDAAKIVRPDGTLYTSIRHRVPVAGVPTNTNNECRACCWPSTNPTYLEDDYKIGIQVNVAGSPVQTLLSGTTSAVVHGYDIVAESSVSGPSRAVARVGLAAGNVYQFSSAGPQSVTNNTARIPPFEANARFVQMAAMSGKFYITDGLHYGVLDPKPTVANPNGTLSNWNASSLGEIPPHARLIARWRNRIVLANTADSPYAWHMSAYGDPNNWDLFPPEPLETQAVSGLALDAAGNAPQVIHAIVPWSDHLLFLGCDKCILRVDGDPMAGGRISVVTDEIGMAFGSPWAKDPEGRVYFFGSRGGVYVMDTSGQIAWLTESTIESDLSQVDLLQTYVTMHWDHQSNGLHVFVMPYGAGGTHLRHFFYSNDTKGWFPQEFGSTAYTAIQPTAACILDGDTDAERVFIFGTEDGRVVKFNADANSDDGYPIDARALIGPIAGPETDLELRFSHPSVVLASELGGAFVKFFASDTPEVPSLPASEFRVGAGRNQRLPVRARGSYVWAQVRSATRVTTGTPRHGERWAVESINVDADKGGRKRVRS